MPRSDHYATTWYRAALFVAALSLPTLSITTFRGHPAQGSWRLSSKPIVEIGTEGDDTLRQFDYVVEAIRTRRGDVAVVLRSRVVVFDSTGRHRFTMGRSGQGPGDLFSTTKIGIIQGDSFAV